MVTYCLDSCADSSHTFVKCVCVRGLVHSYIATLLHVSRVWNDKGQVITRQYTPVSPLDQLDWFEVVIKVGCMWGRGQYNDELTVQAVTFGSPVEVLLLVGIMLFCGMLLCEVGH